MGHSVLEHVEANLNYFEPPQPEKLEATPGGPNPKPAFYVYRATEEELARSPQIARHRVSIANARLLEDLSLDGQGVVLTHWDTADSAAPDFYDAAQVSEIYYPQVEKLVREETGARRVIAFDHNVGCAAMGKRGVILYSTTVGFLSVR